jgi:hypothetical protein
MDKKLSLLHIILLVAFQASAQIGVGTDTLDPSAILDVTSMNKGVLIPRIQLNSITHKLGGRSSQPNGLLVYNMGNNDLAEGFYFWSGAEWEYIESSSVITPDITGLDCNHTLLDPKTFTKGQFYEGVMKVPYTGGNGGRYPAGTAGIPSSGNTGLTAWLKAGELDEGRGYLIYDVKGMPTKSTPDGATFPIVFGTHQGSVTVGDAYEATVKSTYSIGAMTLATDGYQRMVTSFDGRFSVRVLVKNTSSWNSGSIQIRNKDNEADIMWNGVRSRNSLTSMCQAGNKFTVSKAPVWSGAFGYEGFTVESSKFVPEQRRYIWTTTDVKDKTVYYLTLMIGASDHTRMDKTNVFMKIDQIQAN